MIEQKSYLDHLISLEGVHTLKELEEVFLDVEEWLAGNPSIYSVDTFDIIRYCFPFTLDSSSIKLSKEAASSDFLSYYYFFNHYVYNPIILDEYEIELYSIFRKLSKHLVKYKNIEDVQKNLTTEFKFYKNNPEEFFNKKLGLLISIIYGLFDNKSLETFKDIINNKLQIKTLKLSNQDNYYVNKIDESKLFTILKTTKVNKALAENIMATYVEDNGFVLAGMKENDRERHLNSTLIDIQVLVRLYAINDKAKYFFENGSLSKRYNFLFLSSTPQKSDKIQKYYLKEIGQNSKPNLLRKNHQFYFMFLLKDLLNSDINDDSRVVQDILHSKLDNCIDKINKIKGFLENNPEKLKQVQNDISFDRKELENSFLNVKIYNDIDDITKKIKGRKNKQGDFQDLLNSLLNRIQKSTHESLIKEVKTNLDTYSISYNIHSAYSRNEMKVLIPIGKDIVRSKLQSLPILMFQGLNLPSKIKNDFALELIRLINSSIDISGFDFNYYELKKELSLSSTSNKLLLQFLGFLSVELTKEDSNEYKIMGEIENLLIISKRNVYKYKNFSDNKLDVEISPNYKSYLEILYFLTWLKRRTNDVDQFRKALKEIENFKRSYKERTPRITHSKALIYVSWACQVKDSNRKIDYFKTSIEFCREAIEEYGHKNSVKLFNKNSLEYAIIGIKNTIIYCYCQMAIIDSSYLEFFDRQNNDSFAPRKLLTKLKESDKLIYDNFFSLNHTEIDLEYCEFLFYKHKGNLKKANKILGFAKKRLDILRRTEERKISQNIRYRESIKRLDELLISS